MASNLADLALRLERAVPPRNGAPADYEALVREAVQQLGQDLPIVTTTTLTIVAGTAGYNLPADFLYVIEFPQPAAYGDVMITNKLIPLPIGGLSERYYVEGDALRIEPVPAYSAARLVKYAATHALDGFGQYPRLSENGARIALLYAQHLALTEQANAQAGDGWSYKIGDESVDKRGLAAAIQAQAGSALKAYETALRPLRGYGSQYRASQFAAVEV